MNAAHRAFCHSQGGCKEQYAKQISKLLSEERDGRALRVEAFCEEEAGGHVMRDARRVRTN